MEYDLGIDDAWRAFASEHEVYDFLQRIPGKPLNKPSPCLTSEECTAIETEAAKKVELIVEEFRRYKVRTEIARKQRDAEMRHNAAGVASPSPSSSLSDRTGLGVGIGGSAASSSSSRDEVHQIRTQMNEQDTKWRAAYEKIAKENETLRNRGGESVLAAQWRVRYEQSQNEKLELTEKLKYFMQDVGDDGDTGRPSVVGKSPEQVFLELKSENQELRKRLGSMRRASGGSGSSGRDSSSRSMGGSGEAMQASKFAYVRQMMLKYLSCSEPMVREHMETALMALFRFTAEEKKEIDDKKKKLSSEPISLAGLFG